MAIWFLVDNSTIFCPILGFGHGEVIWHNWAKNGPNMGVAVPRAPAGGWSPGPPLKLGHRSYFSGQLLSRKQVSQKIRLDPFLVERLGLIMFLYLKENTLSTNLVKLHFNWWKCKVSKSVNRFRTFHSVIRCKKSLKLIHYCQ